MRNSFGALLPAGQYAASAAELAASTEKASCCYLSLETILVKIFDTQADAQLVGTFPVV